MHKVMPFSQILQSAKHKEESGIKRKKVSRLKNKMVYETISKL